MVPAEFRATGFFDLLCDSIFQYRTSVACENSYENNRHARASIVAAALALESAANCFLDYSNIPPALAKDLDRLPVISKFETCLRLLGKDEMDRGCIEAQRANDLIKVRNDFVHSKTRAIQSELGAIINKDSMVELPVSMTGEIWPALKIQRHSIFWTSDSAMGTLKAALSFLRYVFADLGGLTPSSLREFLVSHFQVENVVILAQFDVYERELSYAQDSGIDCSFLLEEKTDSLEITT